MSSVRCAADASAHDARSAKAAPPTNTTSNTPVSTNTFQRNRYYPFGLTSRYPALRRRNADRHAEPAMLTGSSRSASAAGVDSVVF